MIYEHLSIKSYPKEYQPFAENVSEELRRVVFSGTSNPSISSKEELGKWLIKWYNDNVLEVYKRVDLNTMWASNELSVTANKDSSTSIANGKLLYLLRIAVSNVIIHLPLNYKELGDTLVSKNINYGNSFDNVVDEFGIVGMLIRFADKISRLTQLLEGKDDLVGEAIDDTIMDIAGYSLLSLVYFKTRYEAISNT